MATSSCGSIAHTPRDRSHRPLPSENKTLKKALIIAEIAGSILFLAGVALLCAGGITGMQPLMFAGAGAAALGFIILAGATMTLIQHARSSRASLSIPRSQFVNHVNYESIQFANKWSHKSLERRAYNIVAKARTVYEATQDEAGSDNVQIEIQRLEALDDLRQVMLDDNPKNKFLGHNRQATFIWAMNCLYELHKKDGWESQPQWLKDIFEDISFLWQVLPCRSLPMLEVCCPTKELKINDEDVDEDVCVPNPLALSLLFDFWQLPDRKGQDKKAIFDRLYRLHQEGYKVALEFEKHDYNPYKDEYMGEEEKQELKAFNPKGLPINVPFFPEKLETDFRQYRLKDVLKGDYSKPLLAH